MSVGARQRVTALAVAVSLAGLAVAALPSQRASAATGDVPTLSWAQQLPSIGGGDGTEVPIVESTDGSSLYLVDGSSCCGGGGAVVTYNESTHLPVASVQLPPVPGELEDVVYQLAASPDGTIFVLDDVDAETTPGDVNTAVYRRRLIHIDPANGIIIKQAWLPGPPAGPAAAADQADGTLLVSPDGSTVFIWAEGDYAYTQLDQFFTVNAATLKVSSSWSSDPIANVYALGTGATGGVWLTRLLYTAKDVPYLQLELDNTSTGKPIKTLSLAAAASSPGGLPPVFGVVPQKSEAVLAAASSSGSGAAVSLLNLTNGSLTAVAPLTGNLGAAAVSPDGGTLYYASDATTADPSDDVNAIDLEGSGAVTAAVGLPTGLDHYGLIASRNGGFIDVTLANGGPVMYDFAEQPAGTAPAPIPTQPPLTRDVTQTGSDVVGDTVDVVAPVWAQTPESVSYQWYEGPNPISGATGTSLVLTSDMYQKPVFVVATATFAGSQQATVASIPLNVELPPLPSSVPTISGKAALGSTLTAHPGAWPSGTAFSYQWNADGVAIARATASTYTVTSAQEGRNLTVTVTGTLQGYAPTSSTSATTNMVSMAPFDPKVKAAIFGPDRYGTAIAISKSSYPKSGTATTVFIASGENYPDALSAAPAAVKRGGPLLLTPSDQLPSAVAAELKRLAPRQIVVVGGESAVSAGVMASLELIAPTVRLAGADRYATSLAVAEFAFGNSNVPNVFFATGSNYADALSAGSYAGANGMPVLLVPGAANTPSAAAVAWLKSAGTSTADIAGGTSAVSAGMQSTLESITGYQANRYAGADRFATNQQINATPGGYPSPPTAFLASATNFPDALTGAAAAGKADAPLYLVAPDCVPTSAQTAMRIEGIGTVQPIGGPAALGAGVTQMAACAG